MFDILGLECRPMQVESAAGAGAMTAYLRPAEGEIWIIGEANGYHDNAGAKNGQWVYGSVPIVLDPWLAVTSADRISCYGKSQLSANAFHGPALPFICDRVFFLGWVVDALGVGEKSYIDAVVYVLRGVRRLTP